VYDLLNGESVTFQQHSREVSEKFIVMFMVKVMFVDIIKFGHCISLPLTNKEM
jgi:hypothetical protein